MDKIKQVFSSDKDTTPSRTSTHGSTGTTSGVGANRSSIDSNSRGTGYDNTDSVGGRGQTLTGSTGTTGATGTTGTHGSSTGGIASRAAADVNDHRHHTEDPSFQGHQHNVREHHHLPGEGEGHQTHDHKHLAAVTKEHHHGHETEEVQRIREHDRHVHHVQHHVQPLKDERHHDTEHTEHTHAPTHIQESHTNTKEDTALIAKLAGQHRDEQVQGRTDRTIVDKGEVVNENVNHHVHHLVQPVIERDTHHHKTVHTTIPIKHTTHEAPIIHQSSTHEPMQLKDFVSQGGDLKSKLTHENAGVLANGECERSVDGPAEDLMEKLHLSKGTTGAGQASSAGAPRQ